MIRILLLSVLLTTAMPLIAQQVYEHYQDGKIWVQLKPAFVPGNLDPRHVTPSSFDFLKPLTLQYAVERVSMPFYMARGDEGLQRILQIEFADHYRVDELLVKLQESGAVHYAEKLPLDRITLTPNDPSLSAQWGLTKINATGAWNFFSTGSAIPVAIVDDAVQITHPDLAANLWVNAGEIAGNGIDDDNNGYIDDVNGWDVSDNDNNPSPPTSSFDHGTHVAGIVGAVTNNSTGVASIGFSVRIMSVKSTDAAGFVTDGYSGIIYAAENGARVINCSWGGPSFSTTAQNVINYAKSLGAVVVAAAGNDDVSTSFYPAAYNHVLSVASTTSTDAKSSFSNYGGWVDVSAPGSSIYSTTINSSYGYKSGTSMASPMVAGLAGLMLSLNPGLSDTDVVNCIVNTTDNINSINPLYSGLLGSGRINANAAMTCVSATLNWPPQALFTENFTTVSAGGAVVFTDQSLYTPASWQWTFAGGTPSAYNGQQPPPIVYNTTGTYSVTLIVTNANGSDTLVKTNHINVVASGGCEEVNLPVPSGWTLTNYYTGSTVGGDGWINGMNVYLDKQKAMYFDVSAQPYTHLVSALVGFGRAYSANGAKQVPVRVYDGTSGSPGALIATEQASMQTIMSDVSSGDYTEIIFSNAVQLPASKKFFLSVDLTNLQWTAGVKDTLSIISNQNGQTVPSAVWEQQSDNNWYQYNTAGSWPVNISLLMHPVLTSTPAAAVFTASDSVICAGNSITFDATGSTYDDTLVWMFTGGNVNTSNAVPPTVIYSTPGTYSAKLFVIGGGCSMLDSAEMVIVVDSTPSVTVGASPGLLICDSGSVTLTASGAGMYSWSPAGTLNTSTGSTVIASPTGTTTYTVTGTTGSCANSTNVTVTVKQSPIININASATSICTGDTISFDGSLSADVNTYSWNFQGGTPATSVLITEDVAFASAGSYLVRLTGTGDCGTDSADVMINVTAPPVANIMASASAICPGQYITFDASASTDASTYSWSFTGGTPSSSGQMIDSTAYAGAGSNYVLLQVSGVCGTDSTGFSVTVNPLPDAQVTPLTAVICAGDAVLFDGSGSTGISSYNWVFTGGTPSASTSVSENVQFNMPGPGIATLYGTNSCGTDSAFSLVIVQPLPVADVQTAHDSICAGDTILIDASGSQNTSLYAWDIAGGFIEHFYNDSVQVVYSTAGSYLAEVIASGTCGSDTAYITIHVQPQPVASVSFDPPPYCEGASIQFDAGGGSHIAMHNWTFTGGTPGLSSGLNPAVVFPAAGSYQVTYSGSNGCGADTMIFQLEVDPLPVVVATASDTTICEGQNVQFDASQSSYVTIYQWTFDGGTPASSVLSGETVSYATAGTYLAELMVMNACGMDSSWSAFIEVGCVGIPDVDEEAHWLVWYDHQSGLLKVKAEAGQGWDRLQVYNVTGQLIAATGQGENWSIDLRPYAAGFYYVVGVRDGKANTGKVLKTW